MCRSLWIDESATNTTVLSSMIMNSPNATAPSVHHFLFSSANMRARTASPPRVVSGHKVIRRLAQATTVFVWAPYEATLDRANVVRLMRRHGFDSYWDLVR